jgi:hypothetical protein
MLPKTFREDTVLLFVDMHGDGWRAAHEGRDRPEEQFVNAWDVLPGNRYWILEFPPMNGGRCADNATEKPQ